MTKPPGGRLLRKKRLRKKYQKELTKRCFKAVDFVADLYRNRFGLVDLVYDNTVYRDCRLDSIKLSCPGVIETPLKEVEHERKESSH